MPPAGSDVQPLDPEREEVWIPVEIGRVATHDYVVYRPITGWYRDDAGRKVAVLGPSQLLSPKGSTE